MKLIYILRLIRGFVAFEIKGGFTERFINLCAAKHISIWDVSIQDDTLQACILVKNYRKLRSVAKKSGCKLTITEKDGLPFYLHKNKKRVGILISVLFFAVFMTIMNRFVWIIEVTGTDTVGHEEIIRITEELGLKKGSMVSSLDTAAISRLAVNHFNGRLLWMAINIKGSKATIEVRDYIDEHIDESFKEPCNLVADFDGTLLTVEIFNGDREVFPGNAVKKGDLLISGVVENRDMSCTYCEARGKITALHEVSLKKKYSDNDLSAYSLKNDVTRNYLDVFSLKIPLNFALTTDKTISIETEKYPSWNGSALPLGYIKESCFNKKSVSADSEVLYLIAADDYANEYYHRFRNTNIIESKTNITVSEGIPVFDSELKCIDFIGVKSPINVEIYEN